MISTHFFNWASRGPQLPATFWSTATNGYLLEPRDIATLYQTDDTSTPVTAVGQNIGRIEDKSPFNNDWVQATAGARPLYEADGTFRRMALDGSADFMQSAATINPGATDKCQVFIGVRKRSDAAGAVLLEASVNPNVNAGAWGVTAPGSAAPNYGFALRGTTAVGRTATTFTAPNTAVLACAYDIAQATRELEVLPQINGAVPTLTGSGVVGAGTGNFLTYTHYLGARAGTSAFAACDVYCVLVRFGPVLSGADFLAASRYVAAQVPGNLIP